MQCRHVVRSGFFAGLSLCAGVAAQQQIHKFQGDRALDEFGYSVCGAGDVDGDGVGDVIVGARLADDLGPNAGIARVFSGKTGAVLWTFKGNSPSDQLGFSVGGAGDINGDGQADLLVGIPFEDQGGQNTGRVQVYSGKDGTVLFTFDGDASLDQLGWSVASAGDVNGDGVPDVIAGAPFADVNGVNAGLARVFSGKDGSVLYTFSGDAAGDELGYSVAGAGDVNGDGLADLLVGAPFDDNKGVSSGMARVLSGKDGSVLWSFDGDSAGDQLGWSVAGAADVNGDGLADLLVGAPRDDNNGVDSGSARVLSGKDGSLLWSFDGAAAGDIFGWSVAGVGDASGDGVADLLVGAPLGDKVGANSGSARVFSGKDGSLVLAFDGAAADLLGWSVGGAGDIDGDGGADLIVGARFGDGSVLDTGTALVFRGKPPLVNGADPNLSLISADVSPISGCKGQSTITVQPKDKSGKDLGPGLTVVLQTTAGTLLGQVLDEGNGSYTQVLEGTPAAALAVVSATVGKVKLNKTADVSIVPVNDRASTVVASSTEVFLNGRTTIVVTPKDCSGGTSTLVHRVVVSASLGQLQGTRQNGGDGSYRVDLVATAAGTSMISVTVDGLPLVQTASVTFVNLQNIGKVIGIRRSGPPIGYVSVQQAVNAWQRDQLARIIVGPGMHEEVVVAQRMRGLVIEGFPSAEPVLLRGMVLRACEGVTLRLLHFLPLNRRRPGIWVRRSNGVLIQGCSVGGSRREGIRLERSVSVALLADTVRGSRRQGVRVRGSQRVLIDDCLIEGNGQEGIRIDRRSSVWVRRSVIRGNGQGNQSEQEDGERGHERAGAEHGRRHGRRHEREHGSERGYGILRQRGGKKADPRRVTLIGNRIVGNHGRVRRGRSDANLGNYDQILDLTDEQPPYGR